MSMSREDSEAERDSNPVTSLMQARRALRVIHKIEQSRAHRRANAEGTAQRTPSRAEQPEGLEHNGSRPRAMALVAPAGLVRPATTSAPFTAAPLTGVEVQSPPDEGLTGSAYGHLSGSGRKRKILGAGGSGRSVHSVESDGQPVSQAKMRWQQACHDITAARAHLRDHEHGEKPSSPDELWSVYGRAGGRLTADEGDLQTSKSKRRQRLSWRYWFNPAGDAVALKNLFLDSWLNILLLTAPLGWVSHFVGWDSYATFILNLVALVPLAMVIGKLTEDLATRYGDTIGGLLNVTFGNAVELILSIVALMKGLYIVVEYSLIGSVLSNTLLVLGTCFLLGGMKYKEQTFNAVANKASASLLFLAAIALIVPTGGRTLYGTVELSDSEILNVSYTTAIILILIYIGYLYFQLKTHHSLFMEEENDEEPSLSAGTAMCCLGLITVLVAFGSEWLTDALQDVSRRSGISEAFIGLIILPIAGNAVEHITAVYVALRNKMDLAIAVALGSSIQISLFVIPIVILVGWASGKPLSLAWDPFLVLVLTLSVIHAQFVSSDGRSNWMMGLQLIGTYVLVAVLIAHL